MFVCAMLFHINPRALWCPRTPVRFIAVYTLTPNPVTACPRCFGSALSSPIACWASSASRPWLWRAPLRASSTCSPPSGNGWRSPKSGLVSVWNHSKRISILCSWQLILTLVDYVKDEYSFFYKIIPFKVWLMNIPFLTKWLYDTIQSIISTLVATLYWHYFIMCKII